jgi:hypothetical protein
MPRDVNATVLAEAQGAYNAPHYLLEIALTSGTIYFTNDNVAVTHPSGGNVYNPLGFTFEGVDTSITGKYSSVRFDIDILHPTILAAVRAGALQGRDITIKQLLNGFTSSALYATTIFRGILQSPQCNDESLAIEAVSPLYALNRECPKRRIQTNCQYAFNDDDCLGGGAVTSTGISFQAVSNAIYDTNNGFGGFTDSMAITVSGSTNNDDTYTIDSVVSSGRIDVNESLTGESAGASITITPDLEKETAGTADAGGSTTELVDAARTEADNYWRTGELEFTSGDNSGESQQVKESTSGSVTVIFPFTNAIAEGDEYVIRRGCNHTSHDCKLNHNNFANYGAFVTIAKRES